MRLWYLRRGAPWAELTGCVTVAVVLTAAVHRWPGSADVLLPYALAACAAAAGFLMDESASAVVSVTARGGSWRVLTRLALLPLPVVAWATLLSTVPAEATIQRADLLAAGAAGCLLVLGGAVAIARAGVERPGTHLSAAAVGLVTLPFVVGSLLGWQPVFPVHPVADWVTALWWGIGLSGLALVASGLRTHP